MYEMLSAINNDNNEITVSYKLVNTKFWLKIEKSQNFCSNNRRQVSLHKRLN